MISITWKFRLPGSAIAALVIFLGLAALDMGRFQPNLPETLAVDLLLDDVPTNLGEPLICVGRSGAADFLYVRRVSQETVVFGYDHWGHGGPESTPQPFTPGQGARLEIQWPGTADGPREGPKPPGRLLVRYSGMIALDATVPNYPIQPAETYLGHNPIGGTTTAPILSGTLLWPDGRRIDDMSKIGTTAITEQVWTWLQTRPWRAALLLLIAVAVSRIGNLADLQEKAAKGTQPSPILGMQLGRHNHLCRGCDRRQLCADRPGIL